MLYRRLVIGLVVLLSFFGCKDKNSFQSSVPAYPVYVEINTKTEFVSFTPENTNSYITVNSEGYKLNDKFVKIPSVFDKWGYGGVVVFVSMNGYVAFDLACPYCAERGMNRPCQMNGIYAVCPECGEQYELASGYAIPAKGISHEALRKLAVQSSIDKLIVTQQQ
jgi:hypothetical protein